MKHLMLGALLAGYATLVNAEDSQNMRTFLFIGTSNSAAWEMQIANPGDRAASVKGGIEALGGELLSYYWGLGNGKTTSPFRYLTIPRSFRRFTSAVLGMGCSMTTR
ncbi:hypothetical protein [Ruegeria sp. HKCCD7255]|uniref:hypothetical protein n=1 Tax=Ruegeria sp. HKCCD7255 TaxID=2683004 RepID=UPI0014893CAA|nr:hypothetical protein [Ruegeria sp. HKCCD7255]